MKRKNNDIKVGLMRLELSILKGLTKVGKIFTKKAVKNSKKKGRK